MMASKPPIEVTTDNSMKMSDQPSMAARKANKMLEIIKKGTQNKCNNKTKPLCKLLRTWQVAHSGPPFTSRPEKKCSEGWPRVSGLRSKRRTSKQNRKRVWKKD